METQINSLLSLIASKISANAAIEAANKNAETALIIAYISAATSIVACLIGVYFNYKNTNKILHNEYLKTYKKIITAERINWIGKLRKDLAKFISLGEISIANKVANKKVNKSIPDEKVLEVMEQLYFYKAMVELRINPEEDDVPKAMNELLETVSKKWEESDFDVEFNNAKKSVAKLSMLSRRFNKKEWDVVRSEARDKEDKQK